MTENFTIPYKFYCFNGVPKVLYVSENGENGEKDKYLNYYSMDWEPLPYCLAGHVRKEQPHKKPDNLDELIEYAKPYCEKLREFCAGTKMITF